MDDKQEAYAEIHATPISKAPESAYACIEACLIAESALNFQSYHMPYAKQYAYRLIEARDTLNRIIETIIKEN